MRYLNQVKIWGYIIGSASMLYGIASIGISFYTSYVYLIPALVSIFIGKLFVDVGHAAKKAFQSEDDSLSVFQPVLHTYSRLLFVFGIILCMTIASYIIFMVYTLMVY